MATMRQATVECGRGCVAGRRNPRVDSVVCSACGLVTAIARTMRRSAAAKQHARHATPAAAAARERGEDAADVQREVIELLSSGGEDSSDDEHAQQQQQPQQHHQHQKQHSQQQQPADSSALSDSDDRGDDEMQPAVQNAPAQKMIVDTDDEEESQTPQTEEPHEPEERKDNQRGEDSHEAMEEEEHKEAHRTDDASSSSSSDASASASPPAPSAPLSSSSSSSPPHPSAAVHPMDPATAAQNSVAASSSPVAPAAASSADEWAALSEMPAEVRDFAFALLHNIDPKELGKLLQQTQHPAADSAAAAAAASDPPAAESASCANAASPPAPEVSSAASRKRRRDSENPSPLSIIVEGSQEQTSQEPDEADESPPAAAASAATAPAPASSSAAASPAIRPLISMPSVQPVRAAASVESSGGANSTKPQRARVAPERYDGVSGFYMPSSVRSPFPSARARVHGFHPFLWENEVDEQQPFEFLPVGASVMHPSTCHAPCAAAESAADFSVGCDCPGGACRPDSCECAIGVQNQYTASGLISGTKGSQRYGECWDKCSCACNSSNNGRSLSAASTAAARDNVLSPPPSEHPLMTRRRSSQRNHGSPASPSAAAASGAPGAASATSTCFNRVVQRGSAYGGRNPEVVLAVFRTGDGRGWGLKTLSPIKRHTFVCEYVGEVIHEYIAEMRGQKTQQQHHMSYMFTPPYRKDEQVQPDFTPQARAAAAVAAAAAAAPKKLPRERQPAPPAKKRRPGRPRKRPPSFNSDSSSDESSDEDSEMDVINMLDGLSDSASSSDSDEDSEGRDEHWQQSNEPYSIDASRIGNIARFANNSCSPNLLAVEVMIAHRDPRLPRVAFFARRDISAGTELTFHYGVRHEGKEFDCICSPKCVAALEKKKRQEDGDEPPSPRTPQILSPRQQHRTPTPGPGPYVRASPSGSARIRRTPVTPMSHLAESSIAIDAAELAARQPSFSFDDDYELAGDTAAAAAAATAATPRALKSLNTFMEDVARPSSAAGTSSFLSSAASAKSSRVTRGHAALRRLPYYWRVKLEACSLASQPFPVLPQYRDNTPTRTEARRKLVADLKLVEAEWHEQPMRDILAENLGTRLANRSKAAAAAAGSASDSDEEAEPSSQQDAAAAASSSAAVGVPAVAPTLGTIAFDAVPPVFRAYLARSYPGDGPPQHITEAWTTQPQLAAAPPAVRPRLPPVILQLEDSSDEGEADDDEELPSLVPLEFDPSSQAADTAAPAVAAASASNDLDAAAPSRSGVSVAASAMLVPAPTPLSPGALLARSPVVPPLHSGSSSAVSASAFALAAAAAAFSAVAVSAFGVDVAASSNVAASPSATAASSSSLPRKRCPFCSTLVSIRSRICSDPRCGWDFSIKLLPQEIEEQEAAEALGIVEMQQLAEAMEHE